jgi:hypothetical protein
VVALLLDEGRLQMMKSTFFVFTLCTMGVFACGGGVESSPAAASSGYEAGHVKQFG